MPEIKKNEELSLDDSVKTSKSGNPILGRLQGPCADFLQPTRNGRKYDESLWEKVFKDPIVLEYFKCGGIPGELDHPADRTETCSEKIAIMMPEPPKKNSDGQLIATFDILDTPNGRITYTLAKYGYKLGISSRGSGDTYIGLDNTEHVDEDSYDFQAFDVVLLPAVKSARMSLIDESFDRNNTTFKKAINEALEKSNDNDKKIMQETLHNLKIDYSPEKDNNIKESMTEDEAGNTGSYLIMDLQEALKKNKDLEKQIAGLKDELSVCYAKDAKFNDLSDKYKSTISKLSESLKSEKALRKRVSILEQKIDDSNVDLNERNKEIDRLTEQVSKLRERDSNKRNLTEDLIKRDVDIKSLREKLGKLNKNLENSEQIREKLEEKNSALEEEVASLNKDNAIKYSQYTEKLNKEKSITEKYKKIAKRAIEKYIGIQALRLGVNSKEITNRLSENYSFDEIDRVCENLQSYNVNISKLPFSTSDSLVSKIKLTESKETIIPKSNGCDDEVDDSLLALAQMS